jgi:hypothetical protein
VPPYDENDHPVEFKRLLKEVLGEEKSKKVISDLISDAIVSELARALDPLSHPSR